MVFMLDTHEGYESPFSWRYGSQEMRSLWSEREKRLRWRRAWVALAEAQREAGLVSPEQVDDLKGHMDDIDFPRAETIEREIRHDLMAELKTYAEQCAVGGGIIHLGATSMDISDNAEVSRQRDALALVQGRLAALMLAFAGQIDRWAGVPCMGWTHLQPAEPVTIGYRLAAYLQDLTEDRETLFISLNGKGIKGAVGSRASYGELLAGTPISPPRLDQDFMDRLGVPAFSITTQTYPRRQDWVLLSALAGLAGTLYRFGFDLRLMQSPSIGEWAEPFGEKQVGSSAMPFKKNPVRAENLCSLGRYVAGLPRIAWDNAAHCLLERTLDDSANRRVIIPEAFLAVDEMLIVATQIIVGLIVDETAVRRNLEKYGVFSASERVLMRAVKAGGDRQELHEVIREHSLRAWEALRNGEVNPLPQLLAADKRIANLLQADVILSLMDASAYTGDCEDRARVLVDQVRESLAEL
jgi:adenylosuccinate lyase